MHEKEKATHWECAAEYRKAWTSEDIDQEQNEHKPDTAKIAKKIADYVRVLKPRLLIAADEAVFADELLAGLQRKFQRVEADATLDVLCNAVRRHTRIQAIVLVDPVAIDAGELSWKARRPVLTVASTMEAHNGVR